MVAVVKRAAVSALLNKGFCNCFPIQKVADRNHAWSPDLFGRFPKQTFVGKPTIHLLRFVIFPQVLVAKPCDTFAEPA